MELHLRWVLMKNYNHEYEENVSKSNHLINLLFLITGIFLLIVILYTSMAISINYFIDYIPYKYDEKVYRSIGLSSLISSYANAEKEEHKYTDSEQKLKKIVIKLKSETILKDINFDVRVIDTSEKANAFAVPTNTILVYNKLIDDARSENEVTFILAHELGHFKNRDFLRSLGFGMLGIVTSIVLFGEDSNVTKMILEMTNAVRMFFSRDQETLADEYGLDLVNKYYGHVGGTKDFFKSLMETESPLSKMLMFESSHPLNASRIQYLEDYSKRKGYSLEGNLTVSKLSNKKKIIAK